MKVWRKVLGVCLIVWGVTTATINSWNAQAFLLQNATIAGVVDQHTFALVDQVVPGFNLVEGDETFRFAGRVFSMKQPGQAVVGALVYAPLKLWGVEWTYHYDYVSNLITMLTSGLAVAMIAVMLYAITKSFWAPMIFSFGTIAWPYAGVSHHDIYAMAIGFAAVFLAYQKRYFWAGIVATLTLFFSMLPLTLPLALGLVIIAVTKDKKAVVNYVLGAVIGLLPSLTFNYLCFGNPLLFPNLAGKVADTIPIWDLANFLRHIYFYLVNPMTSLWAFSPILLFGICGYKKLRKVAPMLALSAVLIPLLQLLHICTQQTFGGYEYGPRYLLPTLPLLALLAGSAWGQLGKWGKRVFVGLLVYSVTVAGIGALTTVMYPMPDSPYAPLASLGRLVTGDWPTYRLLPLGVILILIGILAIRAKRDRTTE